MSSVAASARNVFVTLLGTATFPLQLLDPLRKLSWFSVD